MTSLAVLVLVIDGFALAVTAATCIYEKRLDEKDRSV